MPSSPSPPSRVAKEVPAQRPLVVVFVLMSFVAPILHRVVVRMGMVDRNGTGMCKIIYCKDAACGEGGE